MKCVVTGGSGYIGTHLIKTLLENGWQVSVLDLKRPRIEIEWHNLDLSEDIGDALNGCDYVFHLAALADARKCKDNPVLCYKSNVIGTVNLLNAAKKADVKRFVLASSAWVSGAQIGETVDENSPLNLNAVNSIYLSSKLAQEALCIAFNSEQGGPEYTILRYGTPYGEWMWKGLVVRELIWSAEELGRIRIHGDGSQSREFLYVGDLCKAHLALKNKTSINKIYNLTGNKQITVLELAKEVVKYFPDTKIEHIPLARVERRQVGVLNDLAKKELGWDPSIKLEAGIKKCIAWWRDQPYDPE